MGKDLANGFKEWITKGTKELEKNDHFKNNQNLSGTAIASITTALNMIINNRKIPLSRKVLMKHMSDWMKLLSELFFLRRQARKVFLPGKYDEKLAKTTKK